MRKVQQYQIKYNVDSTNNLDKWKLITNEKEVLVSSIVFNSRSKIDLSKTNDIVCEGYLKIVDNIAFIQIKRPDNPHKRHLLKTITYRLLGSLITIITVHLFGVSLQLSSLIGLGELLIKPIVYFVHETLWFKFGKIN